MPQLGESVVEGIVGRWLIAEGEQVQEYQPLLEVESDKVNTELPAPASGVLLKILVPAGTTVSAGTALALIGERGEAVPSSVGAGLAPAPGSVPDLDAEAPGEDGQAGERPGGRGIITPVVARIAAEHGIDLAAADIRGTGRGGRITKGDILAYVERQRLAARDIPPWEQPGSGELFKPTEEAFSPEPSAPATLAYPAGQASGRLASLQPLTSIRQIIAARMVRTLHDSAQVTTVMEADMSRVAAYRERYRAGQAKAKLTFTPFFVQAVVEGLKAVPEANSSFGEDGIRLNAHMHIGIAVALETGLIVPVIRDADRLSLSGLQHAVSDLAERARAGRLKPDEVQDSTFTITNHGVGGSLLATPIINPPNAGILGVGLIQKRPVVVTMDEGDSIAIKPMCYLSFTFDHRVMDGALADRFLARVVEVLERWG
jgi:2-oxoglutarate dehydrogenase E2 component (dihydrolipoamide succinyltransferase)